MAKIILTNIYFDKNKAAVKGLVNYMGTRDKVEKLAPDLTSIPPTSDQEKIIKSFLKRFPKSAELLEYEDYNHSPNAENAQEFIDSVIEKNMNLFADKKNIVEYMGRRKNAERFGEHGLFTESGVPIDIEKKAEEIANHQGRVFFHVVSLRREDAARLGYDNAKNWQDLLQAKSLEIAKAHKMPVENLRYAAAFHDESHHPHVHLAVYSADPKEGYITEHNYEKLKSTFATEIFRHDLMNTYEQKTVLRDELRKKGKLKIQDIVAKINNKNYDNPEVQNLLYELNRNLKNRKGRKLYGSIGDENRQIVDKIIAELEKDEDIKQLYDAWYEQQETVISLYRNNMPRRKPLVMQEEFKPIKNAVIAAAMSVGEISDIEMPFDSPLPDSDIESLEPPESEDFPDEPDFTEYRSYGRRKREPIRTDDGYFIEWTKEYKAAKKLIYSSETEKADAKKAFELLLSISKTGNALAIYDAGMMYRKGLGTEKDEEKSNVLLSIAFKAFEKLYNLQDFDFITYRLGKMHCQGLGTEINYEEAFRYFTESSNKGNLYAKFSLGNLYFYGNGTEQDYDTAYELYLAATENGNAFAHYKVAEMSERGIGTVVDKLLSQEHYEVALKGFLQMTEKAIDDSMYNRIGQMYMLGLGTEKDIALAEHYFIKAAELENPKAKYNLAKLYLDTEYCSNLTEDGKAEKTATAISLLEELIEKYNDKNAKYVLAKLYIENPEKQAITLEWLKELSAEDHEYATYLLGKIYYNGETIEQDFVKAEYYWLLIADKNDNAKYNLAKMYMEADYQSTLDEYERQDKLKTAFEYLEDLVLKNHEYAKLKLAKYYLSKEYKESGEYSQVNIPRAVSWLTELAENNNQFAQCQLGMYYLFGDEKDIEKATYYLTCAAENGNEYAAKLLDDMNNYSMSQFQYATTDLFRNLAKLIESDYMYKDHLHFAKTDRKQLRKELEKKQALGIRI